MALGILGAKWRAEHGGTTRVGQENVDGLRKELLEGIHQVVGSPEVAKDSAIRDEVDRFLENGRVSASNLNRLERRVLRQQQSPLSARSGSASYSMYSPGTGPMSARMSTSSRLSGALASQEAKQTNGGPSPMRRSEALQGSAPVCIDDMQKWSQMALHARLLAEREKAEKIERRRRNQEEMRAYLDRQIEAKAMMKQQEEAQVQRIREQTMSEVEQWREAEATQHANKKEKALALKHEREGQKMASRSLREQEKLLRKAEEVEMAGQVASDIQKEQKADLVKKHERTETMKKFVAEWERDRGRRGEGRQERIDEERRQVAEYEEMLRLQQIRNRQPKYSHAPEQDIPRRKEDEAYSEDNLMRQMRERAARKDQAERQEAEERRAMNMDVKDFLFTQISERRNRRTSELEQKVATKVATDMNSLGHLEQEKKRIEEQRSRNFNHRQELEEQMAIRRARVKEDKDGMSTAERAINKRLIGEAVELRQQMFSGHP